MQQTPGMRREATWGFQLSWYLYKDDDDDDDDGGDDDDDDDDADDELS